MTENKVIIDNLIGMGWLVVATTCACVFAWASSNFWGWKA